jgi:hypothetical protein
MLPDPSPALDADAVAAGPSPFEVDADAAFPLKSFRLSVPTDEEIMEFP